MQAAGNRQQEINGQLNLIIQGLDRAIERAVENPLDLAGEGLSNITAACQAAEALQALPARDPAENGAERQILAEGESLLWQVRARAGRLQMLLTSAASFYSNCFSAFQPEELAYGVQGEWNEMTYSSHLVFDC